MKAFGKFNIFMLSFYKNYKMYIIFDHRHVGCKFSRSAWRSAQYRQTKSQGRAAFNGTFPQLGNRKQLLLDLEFLAL